MPRTATGSPMGVISKTPSGRPPAWSSRPETTRLVEVPSSVTTPPSRAANETGIRNRDGDTPRFRHQVITSGMSIATSGVLGKTVDAVAVGTSSRAMAVVPWPSPSSRDVSAASIPVFCAPRARMYSAATVSGAEFEKPANA